MDEVEVTVRMPREVFDGAVRGWRYTAADHRKKAAAYSATGDHPAAAVALFRAAMLEHTPPWEPTEEQVTAYCELLGLVRDDEWTRRQTKADLIAAHAVLCEGDR